MRKINNYRKFLVLLLLFLMPIDLFSPTASILREAGAKPFNIFVVSYLSIYLIIKGKFYLIDLKRNFNINIYLIIILILGSIAFFVNTLIFEYPFSNRAPEYQFLTQFLMFSLFILVFNVLRLFFLREDSRQYVVEMIPVAVFLHLLFFCLEFFGYFNPFNLDIFILFRNNNGLIDRASGLMSEPSYFGVFSGLFAVPLLLFCKGHRVLNIFMALALCFFSALIQAKTFFIVLTVQAFYLFWGIKKSLKVKALSGIFILALVVAMLFVLSESSIFEVEENLSSAMRFGSSLLALNVATAGYGLLGIGFGQFHFFYTQEYSPQFLLLSQEALAQMSNATDSRASTFNLPLRLLVETGIFGLITSIVLIFKIFKHYCISRDPITQIGLLLVSGSIGFLLTQDSYCLPSLALGLALITSQPRSLLNSTYKSDE